MGPVQYWSGKWDTRGTISMPRKKQSKEQGRTIKNNNFPRLWRKKERRTHNVTERKEAVSIATKSEGEEWATGPRGWGSFSRGRGGGEGWGSLEWEERRRETIKKENYGTKKEWELNKSKEGVFNGNEETSTLISGGLTCWVPLQGARKKKSLVKK